MRASNMFPMSGDDKVGQHFNLTNIPGPKQSNREIFYVLGNDGIGSDIHTRMEEN